MSFESEMKIMSREFHKSADKIAPLPAVPWLKSDDGLSRLYEEFPRLMERGEVYYASLVQANSCLFKPANGDYTPSVASIIYNHKRPRETVENPMILRIFSHYLYGYKGKKPEEIPEWIQPAVSAITDELDRSRVVIKAGAEDDFAMNITLQSVLVFRDHLPKTKLDGGILPIIAAPKECESVMILPQSFWSSEFIRDWSYTMQLPND
ncbi:MAG: hypothetical protein K2N06_11930 [Oscillospiraceae bacterium]|nr:hypothetical protein [Oscillospiraceae bacterium]